MGAIWVMESAGDRSILLLILLLIFAVDFCFLLLIFAVGFCFGFSPLVFAPPLLFREGE